MCLQFGDPVELFPTHKVFLILLEVAMVFGGCGDKKKDRDAWDLRA